MAKLESSLKNMLLSLTLIALVAAGLLAGVYTLTKDTIDATNAKIKAEAKVAVLPQIEGMTVAEEAVEANGILIYNAYAGEELVGAAVEVNENGFGGNFRTMVGFDKEGTITGFQVLEHQETPGLGSKMQEWFTTDKNRQNVVGVNPGKVNFTVSKDGGDVDAITAATISSRAFLLAVTKAYNAYMNGEVEGVSGATQLISEVAEECEAAILEGGEEANVEPANEEE